jgi:beta-fructofuranosidase
MLYVPHNPLVGLWDTWVFHHDGLFHLFHLQRDQRDVACTVIAHAVSRDRVHWLPVRDALSIAASPAWDSGALMTGMTLQGPDGRFYLFYGSMVGGVQRIGVAVSHDLYHFTRHPGNPVIEPDGRWYETRPEVAANLETAWRDPCIVWDDATGAYYAFFCARVPHASDAAGGAIGVARSADLITWDVLPPAFVSDRFFALEVPDVFHLDGRWYMLFSSGAGFGTYPHMHDPHIANGTFYLMSDSLLSGWYEPEDSIIVGSRESRLDAYVGRTFMHAGARLFYHHYVTPRLASGQFIGALGHFKRVEAAADGALRLRYSDALEPFAAPAFTLAPAALAAEDSPHAVWHGECGDLLASITLTPETPACTAGVILGWNDALRQGLAITLDPAARTLAVSIAFTHPTGGTLCLANPMQARTLPADVLGGTSEHLRIIARGPFLDLYVNDTLALIFVWRVRAHGRFGTLIVNGRCVFSADIQTLTLDQEEEVTRAEVEAAVAKTKI